MLFKDKGALTCYDPGARREGRQGLRQDDRTGARAAAAVGRRKGLVQVDMHGIDTEVARTDATDNGVEVGAIAVEITAGRVNQVGNGDDVALEQAAGIGVGQHDRRQLVAGRFDLGLQVGEIDTTIGGLGDFTHRIADEGSGGRVGAVR